MSKIIVTSVTDAGGTSLAEAIAQANASSGADRIEFSQALLDEIGVATLTLSDTLTISGVGGELVIDGDLDDDGLADIILDSAAGPHLEIQSGAEVTIEGIDFVGGFQLGEFGSNGQNGSGGTPGTAGTTGDGYLYSFVDGGDGGNAQNNATDGQDGEAGGSAVGGILNRGDLTLVRVGFGANKAQAVPGANGGNGGDGGNGGSGGSGSGEPDFQEPSAWPTGPSFSTEVAQEAFTPASGTLTPISADPPTVGGDGGDGGDGANGGDGGKGGDAAGAIYNASGATLTLVDVTFGGRLASGLVSKANFAIAGDGGQGGFGGIGGTGGSGGTGGRGNAEVTSYGVADGPDYTRDPTEPGDPVRTYHQQAVYANAVANPAGVGGLGGDGGDSGLAGNTGDGGNAATLLNLGTVQGTAAFTTSGPQGFANLATAGAGDAADIRAARPGGEAGVGGLSGDMYPASFKSFLYWWTWSPSGESPGFLTQAEELARRDFLNNNDIFESADGEPGVDPGATRTQSDGGNAGQGASAEGSFGADGQDSQQQLNVGGTGMADQGDALVYVHGLGQTGGTLAFNVIRLGDLRDALTVGWRLVGDGSNPVGDADFTGGNLPQGTVTFSATDVGAGYLDTTHVDRSNNVVRIEISIASDTLQEGLEGYRLELIDPGQSGVVLGTSKVSGTIDDELIMPSGNVPTNGDDILNGTSGRDVIKAKGGNDTVRGKGGNDKLFGENGRDKLFGDGGNDVLKGGAGKDKLYGSSGKDKLYGEDSADILDGGSGIDRLTGGKGNDSLKGGSDNDIFVFGKNDGKDTIQDFQNQKDRIDLKAFKFSSKNQALKHFAELGTKNDDKVKFDFKGTEIKIKGVDLKQIDAHDIII